MYRDKQAKKPARLKKKFFIINVLMALAFLQTACQFDLSIEDLDKLPNFPVISPIPQTSNMLTISYGVTAATNSGHYVRLEYGSPLGANKTSKNTGTAKTIVTGSGYHVFMR